MTPDELRALGQAVYDAINAQDLTALERLFTPDIVRHAMGEVGFDAARAALTSAFAGAPDLRFQVDDLIAGRARPRRDPPEHPRDLPGRGRPGGRDLGRRHPGPPGALIRGPDRGSSRACRPRGRCSG